jgi:hypothetical protein
MPAVRTRCKSGSASHSKTEQALHLTGRHDGFSNITFLVAGPQVNAVIRRLRRTARQLKAVPPIFPRSST